MVVPTFCIKPDESGSCSDSDCIQRAKMRASRRAFDEWDDAGTIGRPACRAGRNQLAESGLDRHAALFFYRKRNKCEPVIMGNSRTKSAAKNSGVSAKKISALS